jgi:trehalose/maltose hydrolase-like predicted phosphorylase
MLRARVVLILLIVFAVMVPLGPGAAGVRPTTRATAAGPAVSGSFRLTATSRGHRYAPTFTGNGYIGVRVPPAGQGYAGGAIPALCEVAGFYAKPRGDVQQRANLPSWSELRFGDGRTRFTLKKGQVRGWRQQLDLRDGVITTTLRWHAPDGRVTNLRYQVFTDRARKYVGVVRLTFTPHWSGRASILDLIDGTPASLSRPVSRSWSPARRTVSERIRTVGTGIVGALVSRLHVPDAHAQIVKFAPRDQQSVGQRASFPVANGRSYTVTKYVGVVTSTEARSPGSLAGRQAARAAGAGFAKLHAEDRAAWAGLWAGRIDVLGNPTLATEVNASEFYLWSSTRTRSDWSISPAGLSSNGYDGHIFWDAETWMHPSLLAQHPALAAGMDKYRFERLDAARAHARQTGYRGARFPWESALDGTEQIPPPVSVNSEGLYEMHITADIAFAQWQHYLATGDRRWLRRQGWPVISGAARFWASKAVRGAGGSYHIRHVTGPDEENPNVNDEAYTNVAAATTLRIAVTAADTLGLHAPARWRRIAARLVLLFDTKLDIHPEYRGYYGQLVKQADVTMLQYPWGRRMSARVAQHDLNYYVPRSDPNGPSMSDAINQIDTAALGSPGCASYVYTERSIQPFMRDVFDQFSETNTGGAFTFMTGIGGFLQEFLYGYSGLRMHTHGISVDPSLTGRFGGEVLHNLQWHGRTFTISVGPTKSTVSLVHGQPLPVTVHGMRHTVSRGHPLAIRTRRPDERSSPDLARCVAARASSAQRGKIPLAAIDGSPATNWQPMRTPSSLTVRLAHPQTIGSATLLWGRMWPPQPKPNVHPPAKPVKTVRPTAYQLRTSTDGVHWRTVARVRTETGRVKDTLRFATVRARDVRVNIVSSKRSLPPPMLDELTVGH